MRRWESLLSGWRINICCSVYKIQAHSGMHRQSKMVEYTAYILSLCVQVNDSIRRALCACVIVFLKACQCPVYCLIHLPDHIIIYACPHQQAPSLLAEHHVVS